MKRKIDAKKTMVRALCILLCVLMAGGAIVSVIIGLF